MKYATAKEFMQSLPGVMYVNLDTATDRPYVKNYSEEIEIRNFISDPQLAQQVIEKIRKEDERRFCNTNPNPTLMNKTIKTLCIFLCQKNAFAESGIAE